MKHLDICFGQNLISLYSYSDFNQNLWLPFSQAFPIWIVHSSSIFQETESHDFRVQFPVKHFGPSSVWLIRHMVNYSVCMNFKSQF